MENGIVHQSQVTPVGALSNLQAFEPSNISEAIKLAQILVSSRLLPKAVATPEAAFAIIATGRELGLTAMQSLRSIHVVEGKPTLSADLMIAIAKRAPECEYIKLVESTDLIATYETKRRGEVGDPTRMSWTIEQAKNAGLTGKDNWRKYPAAMLRARCAAAICRAVYPDTLLGVYETDELSPGRGVPDMEYAQIVDSPEPAPANRESAATVASDLAKELELAFDAATSADEVRAVSRRVSEARKADRLTDAQVEPLRAARANAERRVTSEAA